MRRSASAQRARWIRLLICLSLLAQSLIPSSSAAAPSGRTAGKPSPAAGTTAARQETEAADLPDLEEVRRRPEHKPKAIPPVPSTRRRCPPRNPRCNDAADGTPAPTPTPAPPVGRPGRGNPHAASAPGALTLPAGGGRRDIASSTSQSFFALWDSTTNGARPWLDLSLLDFITSEGGYAVSDSSPAPASLPRGAATGKTDVNAGTAGATYNSRRPLFAAAAAAFQGGTNLAQGKPTAQSSTLVFNPPGDAWRAVDGNTDGNYFVGTVTHTNTDNQPWWQVDLGAVQSVGTIHLWNRTDCCAERLANYYVFVSDAPFTSTDPAQTQAQAGVWTSYTAGQAPTHATLAANRAGRYVRVQLAGTSVLSLAEVQVFQGEPQAVPPQGIPPAESVAWTNAVGVTASGNSLEKPGAAAWNNAGAMSTKAIASGDGYVEFTASETNTYRMLGLSHGDSNQDYTDIDFALYQAADGNLYVYEAGVYRGSFGTYATGDRLRVSVAGGVVRYSKNGVVLYTSAAAPRHPLLADAALYSTGATLNNVLLSGSLVENVVWTNVAGVSAAGNNLTRGTGGAWNAGASSNRVIAGGDGYAEFTALETNTYRMFGLSRGDSNQDYTDIDFAIYPAADGNLYVYEAGVYKAALGAYAPGDRLRVSVEGGQVRYRRNGALLYTSSTPPQYPLLIDTAFYSTGSTVHNAVISAPLTSQTDPGGTGLTGRYYDNLDFTGFAMTRLDYTVNYDWGGGAPTGSMGVDDFSVRWTGMVVPRYTETYTFYTTTDDGVRLWVDGQLIIDKWLDQAPYEWSGTIALEAGRQYSIRMEYYERWGGAMAWLKWSSASQAKEIVPQSRLLPCWKGVEQFVADFYQAVLRRAPSSYELQDWTERLTQAQGESQQIAAAQALGRTLLSPDSAEYMALNPSDNSRFVSDLYWGYLQRAPDAGGLSWWTGEVNAHGRWHGIAAFENSIEFKEKVARLCGTAASSGTNGGDGYNFAAARLDPSSRTGGGGADAYSRNYNFSIPLVSLAGRAGLDLGLTLSYNSLVWTKDGTGVTFDADRGTPGPGFRLGFPALQPKFVNPQLQQTGQPVRYSYLLVTPGGGRVELRQVGTTNVYESVDSSYLQLTEGDMTLRSTDGTQLAFVGAGGEWRCYQVKDRNGNYLSASYYGDGRIWTVTDTLGRVLTFNYDNYQNLLSITQPWRRETEANPAPSQDETHQWATFGYANVTLLPQFSNLAVIGEQPGTVIPALSQVGLDDGSYYKFAYNQWGQVWKVTHYAADSVGANGQPIDSHPLSSTRLDLPGSDLVGASAQADCPRYTQERTWVEKGVLGQSAEAVTQYDAWVPGMAACEVTLPDGTTKEVITYATAADGWMRGLKKKEEIREGGQLVKTTTLEWEHDGGPSPTNPRMKETTSSNPQGGGHTTRVTYTVPADFRVDNGYAGTLNLKLPRKIEECTLGCATVKRTTVTDYSVPSLDQYVTLRILGLARHRLLYEGAESPSTLRSKLEYFYDDLNAPGDPQNKSIAALPSAAAQHAAAYGQEPLSNGQGGVRWRGNANRVRRHWVNQSNGAPGSYVETRVGFNVTGTVAYTKDAEGHKTSLAYADAFFLNINRTHPDPQYQLQTYAYPTALTDPDGYTSSTWYNYDLGAVTKLKTPKPNDPLAQAGGPEFMRLYDAAGRLVRLTNNFNAARARWVFPAKMDVVESYALAETTEPEVYSAQVLDGAGRVRASVQSLPGSAGGFSAQLVEYDLMGRVARRSNPTETTATGSAWPATGDDAPANGGAGWAYTQTAYDWKGRPRVITNPGSPATTKEFIYSGCGCAGDEVVVARDEAGKRQKVTYDVLGREVKSQDLTVQSKGQPLSYAADESDVYRTTLTDYDVRDQVALTQSFAGQSETDPAKIRSTVTTFDGYGRVETHHAPMQKDIKKTTYTYYADDAVATVTDGRGAVATYHYNGRHLVEDVTHDGTTAGVPSVTINYNYDAAGNRLLMDEGAGGSTTYVYDQLSLLQTETRQFGGLAGSFPINYLYNLRGQLKKVTDSFNTSVNYAYDEAGRVREVTNTGYANARNVANYATQMRYRAWGGLKGFKHGADSTHSVAVTYDARLRVKTYGVNFSNQFANYTEGVVLDYYADGLLKTTDKLGNTFTYHNRNYFYDDPVGRLTKALTADEARGVPITTVSQRSFVPFQQNYEYDAWDNVKRNYGWHWTKNLPPVTSTYSAGARNQVLFYDDEGNVTQEETRTYTYDAASRLRTMTEPPRRPGRPAQNIVYGYDGDNRQVRREANGTATYQLRSTLLRGEKLTDLNAQGQKVTGHVYVNGTLLARQIQGATQADSSVSWIHESPDATGQWVTTSAAGGEHLGRTLEIDPMGRDVGIDDPYASGGDGMGSYPIYGDPGTMNWGCAIDGFTMPCAFVSKFALRDHGTRHYILTHTRIGTLQPSYTTSTEAAGEDTVSHGGNWEMNPNNQNIGTVTVTAAPEIFVNRLAGFNMVWLNLLPTAVIYTKMLSQDDIKEKYSKIRENLRGCVLKLYGVELKSFTPAAPGGAGSFSGVGFDKSKGKKTDITVDTNVTAYDKVHLYVWYKSFLKRYPELGYREPAPGTVPNGLTLPSGEVPWGTKPGMWFSPYLNFVANDATGRQGPLDAEGYQLVQIHELGHALSIITGKKLTDEDGDILEFCVYGQPE